MKKTFLKIGFYLALIIAWEIVARLHVWPEYLFPSPVKVGQVFIAEAKRGTLFQGIGVSMRRIALGYGISVIIGMVLGLMLARIRLLKETAAPMLMGLRSLPSICWLPLGMLWFGLNEKAILFVVLMGAIFPVALATSDGVRNVSPIYLRAASTLGVRGFRLFTRVVLPAALPAILSGMKLGWAFAWRSLMAAEMVFVTMGLGQLLMVGRELNDMARVIAAMIAIVAIGMIVDRFVFGTLEARVRRRWGLETAGE